MNKISILICFLFGFSPAIAGDTAKTPEIFLAVRSEKYLQEFDWYTVIQKALVEWHEALNGDPLKEDVFKDFRFVLLEEDEYWTLMIFEKGNGRIGSETDGFYSKDAWDMVLGNGNNLIYLDKESLKLIKAPEGAVIGLPYSKTYMLPSSIEDEHFSETEGPNAQD